VSAYQALANGGESMVRTTAIARQAAGIQTCRLVNSSIRDPVRMTVA